jgi:archaellum biogenesis ATPase FlaH
MAGLDDILSSNENYIYNPNLDDIMKESSKSAESVLELESDAESIFEQETFLEPEIAEPRLAPKILSSGIFVLDRSMGGGLPAWSVVYISASTKSMSEVFLYQFTQSRKTFYFCTERRTKYVKQDIQNMNFDPSDVVFVDVYESYFLSPHGEMIDNVGNEYVDAKIIEFTEYNLKSILAEAEVNEVNIIIDTFSFFLNLNVNRGAIRRLLNIIYETTKETGGLTFLYGLKDTQDKKLENEILNTCDGIFDVDLEKTGDKIVSKLSIPKIRGMTPTAEMIKFKIGEGIQIDTSKDIA